MSIHILKGLEQTALEQKSTRQASLFRVEERHHYVPLSYLIKVTAVLDGEATIFKPIFFLRASGLPDGIFSNQKSKSGQILECLAMEDVPRHILWTFVQFYVHFAICMLWAFGLFYGHLVFFNGHLVYFVVIWYILVCCTKRNLATLLDISMYYKSRTNPSCRGQYYDHHFCRKKFVEKNSSKKIRRNFFVEKWRFT
jgi:hypothetical protein